ncbi:hypothetical protein CLV47_12039 [Antricoccus suffuscus]|uniref:Vitamin K-dependent gamma-carboxylase-like protein n=1 Tax=Antricoccus suffuscus TaxID=1629062 RepID=A0A2T0ZQE2_9ACTN|nr:MFS transporter permease [Antricoccus suffuscus]PRZ38572.1 hypothetical protein CLV47_12039 [Antricoccus suffuscus]
MDETVTTPRRSAFTQWFVSPVALHRVAVIRVIAYLFILVDVFLTTSWVALKAYAPTALYHPLVIGDLFHLPTPTYLYVTILKWVLVVSALVAATAWKPRLTGTIVAVAYLLWMIVAMSYGKVDHDRFAFLVLLAVLPTVGPAKFGDVRRSERAGWAMQMVFISVMLTYFLASIAKIRFGGWDWATGATITRAVLRRGTDLVDWTVNVPGLLILAQFAMVILETLSPLMLLCRSPRARIILVAGLLAFHIGTFASITIIFLPHCVAILSILPWETFRRGARKAKQPEVQADQPRDESLQA